MLTVVKLHEGPWVISFSSFYFSIVLNFSKMRKCFQMGEFSKSESGRRWYVQKRKKKFWKEKDDCVCSANTQGISEMFTGNFVTMQWKPDSGDVTAGPCQCAAQQGGVAEGPVRTSRDTPLIIKMLPDLT